MPAFWFSLSRLHRKGEAIALLLLLLCFGCTPPLTSTDTARPVVANHTAPRAILTPDAWQRIRVAAAKDLGLSEARVQPMNYSQETWSDRCLGLAQNQESCQAVSLIGWRVEVAYTKTGESALRRLFYRANHNGTLVRREPRQTLPAEVRVRLLSAATAQLKVSQDSLELTAVEPRLWDSCFGFQPQPGANCHESGVMGWRGIVRGAKQQWVFHLDREGDRILLNEAATVGNNMVLGFIPPVTRGTLGDEVGFQSRRSRRAVTYAEGYYLAGDGRIVQFSQAPDAPIPAPMIRRLAQWQQNRFFHLVQRQAFKQFDGLSYFPASASPDAPQVTLTSLQGRVQYAEGWEAQLPPRLRNVVQAWQRLTR